MNWLQKWWLKLGHNWILENSEPVILRGPLGEVRVVAKIDTGAGQSSIDVEIAKKIGLLLPEQQAGTRNVKSGLGKQVRSMVNCEICIKNQWVKTTVTYTDRSHLTYPVLIGRQDIPNFLVKTKLK